MECIVASTLSAAHGYFLYSGYQSIASGSDDLSNLSFVPCIVGPAAYLAMVFLGQVLMRDRKPFNCKASMAIYNLYATGLSLVMLFVLGRDLLPAGLNVWTTKAPYSTAAIKAAVWLNYQSKFIEYLDTLFMVLRKKDEQITSLHLIHHAEMGPLMFLWAKDGSLNSSFGPMINSFIHSVMYSYYGLAGLGVRLPLLFKQSMTSMQMVQFVVIMFHSIFHMVKWDQYWPGYMAFMELLLMLQMLYMFGNFFVSKYTKKPQKTA